MSRQSGCLRRLGTQGRVCAVTESCPISSCLPEVCRTPEWCPLSRVQVGSVVVIRQLTAAPEVNQRLREMGFGEKQRVKVLAQHNQMLCLVCNARLGLNSRLANDIWVEPLIPRQVV
jgi:Fe2+ transport system protein FeoA